MSKKEYVESLSENLREFANNKLYINISQLAKALGVARETAAQMVFKLKYLPNGREKLFFIGDVANCLFNTMSCDWIGGAMND